MKKHLLYICINFSHFIDSVEMDLILKSASKKADTNSVVDNNSTGK